jgi:hypothetical protein
MTELRGAPASDLWRYTADLLYVLENPVVREAFFPCGGLEYAVEPARSQDERAILDIIEQHENSVAARYLTRWWKEAPETFAVARDRKGSVAGFYIVFDPMSVPGRLCREDPVTCEWLDHLDQQPMPRQQRALFLRRWLSADGGEAPSAVQAACWVDVKRKSGAPSEPAAGVSGASRPGTVCRGGAKVGISCTQRSQRSGRQ